MSEIHYVNRGKARSARITDHARERFAARWLRVWADAPELISDARVFDPAFVPDLLGGDPDRVDDVLRRVFAVAAKVRVRGVLARRSSRYGGQARFCAGPFHFVIRDGALVTVELQGSALLRALNRGVELCLG